MTTQNKESKEVPPVVEATSLTKVYRDFWGRPKVLALDRLDLEIRSGEIFGLLGPNGAGKTTTTKLLLGLIFPTSGEVRVFGRSPRSTPVRRRIGYLPEESYLYRFLNGEETLDFYGSLYGLSRRERRERAAALLDRVGLGAARKRRLKEYSKGMARRIGLAQALIGDPDLLLLDEPTSGLDPMGTREVKDLILGLRDEGKTVLLCSHLLADVAEICDRIAILNQGQVRVLGKVDDLLQVKDELRFVSRGGSAKMRRKVEGVLGRAGVEVLSADHPRMSLEDLFVRTVTETSRREEESGA